MKKSIIKILFLLALVTVSMTSCLKDLEDFKGEFSTTPAIAEFNEASNASTGTIGREIVNPLVPTEFSLRVNIASPSLFTSATTFTIALDDALLTAYNAEHNLTGAAAAVPVPAAAITITSYDVTVDAGKREAEFYFTLDGTKMPNAVTTFYGIGIKIASVSNGLTISGNAGSKVVRILSRNEFDGKYKMKGFIMRPGDTGGLEGYFKDKDYSLSTVSGNAVIMNKVQCWADGSNVGGISPWTVTVDKSGGVSPYPVTLADPTQGTNFIMTPGYPSRYDAATKTFYWQVNWGATTPKNRGCTDTLVFYAPR